LQGKDTEIKILTEALAQEASGNEKEQLKIESELSEC